MNQLPWPADFGRPRLVTIANPAAGADFTQTVDTNTIWALQSLQFTFGTDANAATRVIKLTLGQGATVMLTLSRQFTQAATLTVTYGFYPSNADANASPGGQVQGTLPDRYFLVEGDVIASAITNIQVGDAFTLIQLRVLEWLHFYA